MKQKQKNNIWVGSLAGIFIFLLLAGNSFGESLFKSYTDKTAEDLKTETRAMSDKIRVKFSQADVEHAQQKIDFHDYASNLKKLIIFGSRLASYADYEADLKFARDNELFKGLPDKEKEAPENKARFVREKYEKMQHNVKDEIDAYKDLILMSLDSCEMLAANDLSGFAADLGAQQKMQVFLKPAGIIRNMSLKKLIFPSAGLNLPQE